MQVGFLPPNPTQMECMHARYHNRIPTTREIIPCPFPLCDISLVAVEHSITALGRPTFSVGSPYLSTGEVPFEATQTIPAIGCSPSSLWLRLRSVSVCPLREVSDLGVPPHF